MSVYASGAISAEEAMSRVAKLPGLQAIVFGTSSRSNIHGTRELVEGHMGPVVLPTPGKLP